MSSTLLERLHHLAAIWGPAGREHKVAEAISDLIRPHVDEISTDRFGNVIAIKRGAPGGKRVLLTAHMDTIGAMALNVSEKGLVYLAQVGGIQAHNSIGQRVVWGSGVVGVLQHEPVQEPKEIDFKKIWCDIGASDREEALENVRLGDVCTFVGELQQLGDLVVGPGIDNRAGCAVLLTVAEHLQRSPHEVAFAFTAQGEIGPRGAGVAAFGVSPDIAFVVDLCTAGDTPRAPRVDAKLGQGPALKLKDGNYMAHQGLSDLVRRVAESSAIPLQTEIIPSPGGHNDAQVVSISGQGVATAVIDIPCRYRGTAAEMANVRDMHGAADLVIKLLEDPLEY